jgi:N-acetylglucosaminyldiphosphoundecaprenol N-acetyl-beta-D-mannosaminyltransferase
MISGLSTSIENASPVVPATSHASSPEPAIAVMNLLGVPFHCLRKKDIVPLIDRTISEKHPRQICLSNAFTVTLAQQDERFMQLLNRASLVLADGMSIVWGGRWIGLKIPERIAGPDFMEMLCADAAEKGHRIFLLGSSLENIQRLSAVLTTRWPNLMIAGVHSPPMCERLDEAENQTIMTQLQNAKPDILFVGMTCPKQEIWIAENLHRLGVPVCAGVGAAFDFLSGRIPRAPAQMRRVGLEWLYRLYCEPRRLWKRYLLGNAIFLSLLLKKLLEQKLSLKPKLSSS